MNTHYPAESDRRHRRLIPNKWWRSPHTNLKAGGQQHNETTRHLVLRTFMPAGDPIASITGAAQTNVAIDQFVVNTLSIDVAFVLNVAGNH